jgi:epoxyqueuosine reductase
LQPPGIATQLIDYYFSRYGFGCQIRCGSDGSIGDCPRNFNRFYPIIELLKGRCHVATSSRHILNDIGKRLRTKSAFKSGIAAVEQLKRTPSYATCDGMQWPADVRSVFVLALEHPAAEPGLDWWDSRPYGTSGNRRLVRMTRKIKQLFQDRWHIDARALPYHVEHGGVFLKDAAVLAGIGIVGENNLLVTPEFGPRVRLRALFLNTDLEQTGPISFDPCPDCPRPCRAACPQDAFSDGSYSRKRCSRQMAADAAAPQRISRLRPGGVTVTVIRYCRACELACVVGN